MGFAELDMVGSWVDCCCIVLPIYETTILSFYFCCLVSEKGREKEHTRTLSIICNKEKTKQKKDSVSTEGLLGLW